MKNPLLQQLSLMMFVMIPVIGDTTKAVAHGIHVQYHQTQAIALQATDEQGNPLIDAQVAVYAPEDSNNPWMMGNTNDKGQFSFNPDFNQEGNWEVKVRQAGHGKIVQIPLKMNLDQETSKSVQLASVSPSGYTSVQKVFMSLVSIWGFVGTALFFARNKSINNEQ